MTRPYPASRRPVCILRGVFDWAEMVPNASPPE
jgi:hypothetical protein